jgi:hypothetical protein
MHTPTRFEGQDGLNVIPWGDNLLPARRGKNWIPSLGYIARQEYINYLLTAYILDYTILPEYFLHVIMLWMR